MKAHIETKNFKLPNVNFATAEIGFEMLGYDIERIEPCVVDWRRQFNPAEPWFTSVELFEKFVKLFGAPGTRLLPYYPKELIENLFCPYVKRVTLGDARHRLLRGDRFFLKPVEEHRKFFAGIVAESLADIEFLKNVQDFFPVYLIEDVLEIESEYRVFIHRGNIVDARKYAGSPFIAADRAFAEKCIEALLDTAPCAYALDIAVLSDGQNKIIEATDMYAIGDYGLHPKLFAELLVDRWNEIFRC